MNRGVRELKFLFVAMILIFSLVVLTPEVKGEKAEQWEVGITFTESSDKPGKVVPKPPKDNTITANKGQAINKRVTLPQTGETVKQLSLFVAGIVLVVMVFALALDRQVAGES